MDVEPPPDRETKIVDATDEVNDVKAGNRLKCRRFFFNVAHGMQISYHYRLVTIHHPSQIIWHMCNHWHPRQSWPWKPKTLRTYATTDTLTHRIFIIIIIGLPLNWMNIWTDYLYSLFGTFTGIYSANFNTCQYF